MTAQPVNQIQLPSGRIRFVCVFCARTSSPRTARWDLPLRWSMVPFPEASPHRDGSTGTLYRCPPCNRRLAAGERLRERHEAQVMRPLP